MAVNISLSITQNSQSVANNTSNVTVKVTARWTYGSYNATGQCTGSITIDGTTYTYSGITFNTGKTTSGSQTIMTKTVNVKHNSDGTKTLSCSASFVTGVSSGTVGASGSKILTTIPRASSLAASNGTLGTAQTLTITRADASFVHKITYTCGSTSGYAVGSASASTSSTSISWTPPLSLANQNTTGNSVSISLILKTYNSAGTQIGTATKTIICAIPDSVHPVVRMSVTDLSGCLSEYGTLIQGISKLQVTLTTETAYGASIKTYKTTANGSTYTTKSFTTETIKNSGSTQVTAEVKDSRGRSGMAAFGGTTLAYKPPAVDKLTVKRCDSDGTENDQGAYCQVTFSATVSGLGTYNNFTGVTSYKNTATYSLKHKPSSSATYTEVSFDTLANNYKIVDQTYIFAADTGSTYNVELYVKDNFITTKQTTTVSTAFTIMHWKADGTAMGIGKVAEESYLLDIGMPTRFNEPVHGNVMGLNKLPEIPANGDFNEYMQTGSYAVYKNANAATIANIPTDRAGRLEVNSATGEGIRETQWSYLRQKYIPYNSSNATWERDISRSEDNVWKYYDWWRSSLTPEASKFVYHGQVELWSGAMYMTAGHTITLTEAVSAQRNGIVLTFSKYADGAAQDNNFNHFFVPKIFVSSMPGYGSGFTMMDINFGQICHKYLYINDTTITGHANNNATGTGDSGITYANNKYVLRYVWGV